MKKGLVRHFLSRKGQKLESAGFTLIELLIVIGILAVLVVTVLVTLNPGEAQKKTRDAARMKNLSTLEAIINQYVNDGGAPICTGATGCTTTGITGQSQPCSANWLAADLCKYANSIPVDPTNNASRQWVNGPASCTPTTATVTTSPAAMLYQLKMSGSDYEINVRQESKSNASNVCGDGGNSDAWAEVGSNLTLL